MEEASPERSQTFPVRTRLVSVAEQVVCENNPDFTSSLHKRAWKNAHCSLFLGQISELLMR